MWFKKNPVTLNIFFAPIWEKDDVKLKKNLCSSCNVITEIHNWPWDKYKYSYLIIRLQLRTFLEHLGQFLDVNYESWENSGKILQLVKKIKQVFEKFMWQEFFLRDDLKLHRHTQCDRVELWHLLAALDYCMVHVNL